MRLFYRKPFALSCFLFILSGLVVFFAPEMVKTAAFIAFCASSLILCAAALILKKGKLFKTASLALIFALLGALHFTLYLSNVEKNHQKYENITVTSEIEATVLSRSFSSNYLSIFDIRVHRIGDDSVNMKMRFEGPYALDIAMGDRIKADVTLSEFESGGSFDEKQYYNSKGVYFIAEAQGGICEVIGRDDSIELFFLKLNSSLCNVFSKSLDEEASGLINAVFLGNRDNLSDIAKRDFKRTGTYHILALSGMHLAILSAMLNSMLQELKIRKSRRYIILPVLLLFYVALTGFSLSVVRSAIMLMATYLAYFLRARKDSLTSLIFAAAAIILFSPASICDIGFWMSVLSTFGIIMALPLQIYVRFRLRRLLKGSLGRAIKTVISGMIISFAAIIMTLPFSCFSFGAISLLGPAATLVLSPFISLILYIAPFFLFLSDIPIIGELLIIIMNVLASLSSSISNSFSEIQNIYISLEYPFVKFLVIPFFAVLAVMLIINIKHKIIIPLFIFVWLCVFSFSEYNALNDTADYVEYIHSGNNEYICISSKGDNILIDISDGSSGNLYEAASEALSIGYCEIERVVLTHLHKRHISSLGRLAKQFMIREVLIPEPITDSEIYVAESVKFEMELLGVKTESYGTGEKIKLLDEISLSCERAYLKRSTHPVLMLDLSGSIDILYVGSSYFEYDNTRRMSENMIIGTHGPICKQNFTIYAEGGASFVSIADDELFSYAEFSGSEDVKIIKNTQKISFVGE